MRSPGSWKEAGLDTSPAQKPHREFKTQVQLEIAEGARQVKLSEMKSKNKGPWRASRAEQDAYLEWVRGYLDVNPKTHMDTP